MSVETGRRNHDDGGRWLKEEGQNSRQSPAQVKGGGIHCGGSNQYGNGVQSSIGGNSKELQNQKNIFAELMRNSLLLLKGRIRTEKAVIKEQSNEPKIVEEESNDEVSMESEKKRMRDGRNNVHKYLHNPMVNSFN